MVTVGHYWKSWTFISLHSSRFLLFHFLLSTSADTSFTTEKNAASFSFLLALYFLLHSFPFLQPQPPTQDFYIQCYTGRRRRHSFTTRLTELENYEDHQNMTTTMSVVFHMNMIICCEMKEEDEIVMLWEYQLGYWLYLTEDDGGGGGTGGCGCTPLPYLYYNLMFILFILLFSFSST